MAENEKTVHNILDRGSVGSDLAVHANNRAKLGPILYVFGGLALMVVLLWTLGKASVAEPPKGAAQVTPTRIVTREVPLGETKIAVALASQTPAPTLTPAPSSSPVPTRTPAPTSTPAPDVWLSLASVAWPKRGWGNARTISGLSPAAIDGWGLACPDNLPLGTRLQVPGGQVFTCVDRAKKLACMGGICTVLLFQSSLSVAAGLYPAWMSVPKSWGN